LGLLEAEGRTATRLVINRIRVDLVRRNDMLGPAQILDRLAIQLLGVVPENEEVLLANAHGTPIAHDPRSVAGKAYNAMARRLLGEEVPFEPLGEPRRGLFRRRRTGG